MEIASIIKISPITATGETVLQTLLSRAQKKKGKAISEDKLRWQK